MLPLMRNEEPGDGRDDVIDLRGELYFVQRQLSRIANSRLSHMLSVEEEHAYRLLARREVELILELADNPLGLSSHPPADQVDDASRDGDIWLESSGPEVSFS